MFASAHPNGVGVKSICVSTAADRNSSEEWRPAPGPVLLLLLAVELAGCDVFDQALGAPLYWAVMFSVFNDR